MDIGKTLHEARIGANKSLQEIRALTKVSVEHLELLESNDFGFLPSTYVKSFLKSFALAVGVDVAAVIREYEARLEQDPEWRRKEDRSDGGLQPGRKEKAVEWGLGFGMLILLIALAFVYVQYRSRIHAEPVSGARLHQLNSGASASPSEKPLADSSGRSSFQIDFAASDSVWLQLTLDGKPVEPHELKPGNNVTWSAEQRIELTIVRKPATGAAEPDTAVDVSQSKRPAKVPKR